MPDVYKQSFKQNYTNNIELSIFNCGLERCAPGQTWGPGIRDHYLIHLVVSGKGIFEVGGRTWEVSEGDLFFARPSQLIRYTADEQQPWEYSWVGFNGACAHKLAAQLPFTDDAPVHHTSDPDGMRAALNNIYSSRGLQPQDEAAMVGYLYLFIAALMRETSAGKPHTASSSSQYVLNAIKYIQFNYSPRHFHRRCGQERGSFPQPSVPGVHAERGQKPHRLPDRVPHQRSLQAAARRQPFHCGGGGVGRLF